MDRLEAMAMLVSSVEQGSLSAAARKLRIPVATLTRNVNDLEALVGTKLLVRTTRKLLPTDAGIDYIASAKRILFISHGLSWTTKDFTREMHH